MVPMVDWELRSAVNRSESASAIRKISETALMMLGLDELAKVSLILSCRPSYL